MTDDWSRHRATLLALTLQVAVPPLIAALRDHPYRDRVIRDWAREAVDPVAAHGDIRCMPCCQANSAANQAGRARRAERRRLAEQGGDAS